MQHCPVCSPSSALLCAPHASLWLQVLNLGLQRTYSLTPPSREMLRHAWSLGLLPLQLVPVPGSHGNTRTWVPSILTLGFPGSSTSLNSFFPKAGTSIRVKSCGQTPLCIWSCCGKTGRILQHVPTAKGWWRKRLEDKRRVITWRSTRDQKQVPPAGGKVLMCSLGVGSNGTRLYCSHFWKMLKYLTQLWGHWGLPLCCCCCWATPSAHTYHALHSPPQQIHPSPNAPEGEMQENTLINSNRGCPTFPPKAFPPPSTQRRAGGL